MRPRYGYLGPEATFTEAALRSLPETAGAEYVAYPSASAALGAVRSGAVDAAMLPLENSVEGGVPATLREFVSDDPLQIVAEANLKVEFALMGNPGARVHTIKQVFTHSHAHGQCRRWQREWLPAAQFESTPSTAAAALEIAQRGGRDIAAIAAVVAAERYGLEVLASDIGDRANVVTRFVLLRRPGPLAPRTGADRTSIVAMASGDRPGWLVHVLDEFASREVPVTRVESRPSGEGLGRYHFLIDCEGHAVDPQVRDALVSLALHCRAVRFLGSYPRGP
ncbi:prephenate dehydratase [Methylocapsa aurea]|uniref:prephenate dehydratase n=1 Tax=Methylocapsa aurea TaxID=663610 RepID=UPI0009FDC575|nr:prephenate dehydratase [Methylocapsa aurea]